MKAAAKLVANIDEYTLKEALSMMSFLRTFAVDLQDMIANEPHAPFPTWEKDIRVTSRRCRAIGVSAFGKRSTRAASAEQASREDDAQALAALIQMQRLSLQKIQHELLRHRRKKGQWI